MCFKAADLLRAELPDNEAMHKGDRAQQPCQLQLRHQGAEPPAGLEALLSVAEEEEIPHTAVRALQSPEKGS